ncbi:unnamed protein product, partial [Mesorhabditis spiculigera]
MKQRGVESLSGSSTLQNAKMKPVFLLLLLVVGLSSAAIVLPKLPLAVSTCQVDSDCQSKGSDLYCQTHYNPQIGKPGGRRCGKLLESQCVSDEHCGKGTTGECQDYADGRPGYCLPVFRG